MDYKNALSILGSPSTMIIYNSCHYSCETCLTWAD